MLSGYAINRAEACIFLIKKVLKNILFFIFLFTKTTLFVNSTL